MKKVRVSTQAKAGKLAVGGIKNQQIQVPC